MEFYGIATRYYVFYTLTEVVLRETSFRADPDSILARAIP